LDWITIFTAKIMDWLSRIVKMRFFYVEDGLNFLLPDCATVIWEQLCEQIENLEITGANF